MNWYSTGLAALSGGLAALIANLVFGKDPERKMARGTLLVVMFVGLMTLSHMLILPRINAHVAKLEATNALTSIPAFVSLSKHAPDTYRQLSKSMMDAIDSGGSPQQATARFKAQLQEFLSTRLAHASDEALVRYTDVMITEMGEFQAQGKGLCYRFLFPQAGGGIDPAKYISKETQAQDLAALDEVIKTSNTKRPIPSQSEVLPLLQPVAMDMRSKHGESVSVLENPTAPGVDKEKVCAMSRELYTRILALPVDKASLTLRWMFGQK